MTWPPPTEDRREEKVEEGGKWDVPALGRSAGFKRGCGFRHLLSSRVASI